MIEWDCMYLNRAAPGSGGAGAGPGQSGGGPAPSANISSKRLQQTQAQVDEVTYSYFFRGLKMSENDSVRGSRGLVIPIISYFCGNFS